MALSSLGNRNNAANIFISAVRNNRLRGGFQLNMSVLSGYRRGGEIIILSYLIVARPAARNKSKPATCGIEISYDASFHRYSSCALEMKASYRKTMPAS